MVRFARMGLFLVALVLGLPGCNPADPTDGGANRVASTGNGGAPETVTPTATALPSPAKEWIDRLLAAYSAAKSYSDEAELTFTLRGATTEKQTFPFAVAYQRPGMVRLRAYQALVTCDGQRLRGKIVDPATRDFDGQIVDHPAPPEINYEALRPLRTELLQVILGGLGGPPPQLALLTQDAALLELLRKTDGAALLPTQSIDGHACRGVQLVETAGRSTWWIDEQTSLLRRVEFATGELARSLQIPSDQVTLVADFKQAKLDASPPAESFAPPLPVDAKLVKYLVPPPPRAPLALLGKPLPNFSFAAADGKPVTNETLAGKVAVLCFFSIDQRAAFPTLSHLNALAQSELKGRGDIRIVAVSTDPASVPDVEIQRPLRDARIDLPIVRATGVRDDNIFGLVTLPTTLVLDAKGAVQDLLPGYNADVFAELPKRIERIAAGAPFHQTVAEQFTEDEKRYQNYLTLAAQGGVAKKSAPRKLRASTLWQSRDVKVPGNIVATTDAEGKPRLVVVDGQRSLAVLDEQGKVVARHELGLANDARVSFVRTALDGRGKRWYAVSAVGQRQALLLDDQFRVTLRYPEKEPAQIADVQLADFDGDGNVDLLIGFLGRVGAHLVATDGKRTWNTLAVEDVSRIGIVRLPQKDAGPRGSQVLIASYRGHVTPFDIPGREAAKWQPDVGALAQMFVVPRAEGAPLLSAIAVPSAGQFVAAGLRLNGEAIWQYPLPVGGAESPIEAIAFGNILAHAPGQWVFAAPDASLHVFAVNGAELDQLNYGFPLGGITTAPLAGDRDAIIVASEAGIEALKLETP